MITSVPPVTMGWIMAADMRAPNLSASACARDTCHRPGSRGAGPRLGKETDVAGDGSMPEIARSVVEPLDEAECLRLISAGGVGRIGYTGRFGPTVLPVNYALYEGTIVFRTGQESPMGEDLRTGIEHAESKVAFEIDEISQATREGWSILVQGSAHPVDSEAERVSVMQSGVEAWAGGEKELFVRVVPTHITGRRIRRTGPPAAG
jgi:nitroimidazol reductase NimA-like FMN-containing flavoprotein (pyridoxamine 5'-phosphate oxidase superfamily)